MKRKPIRLLPQYGEVLRRYLAQGAAADLACTRTLGLKAAELGLRALDLARIHEEALTALGPLSGRAGLVKQTNAFFAEVLSLIEQASGPARAAATQLRQAQDALRQHSFDLAASHQLLKQGVVQRKALETALTRKVHHSLRLLTESRGFEKCLQSLARQILSLQENERATISRTLHNEIAQGLLGIQVRLAALKEEAARNITSLKEEITSTQRLVKKSAKTLDQFADSLA